MSTTRSGQKLAARDGQLRSWAENREARRRAICLGYLRSFVRDNPTDGPDLVAEVAAIIAASLHVSEKAS